MNIPIQTFSRHDRKALLSHFTALEGRDRRLRFGAVLSDAAIGNYVQRIDYHGDVLMGVYDDEMRIVAVVHLAVAGDRGELGLSVLPGQRGLGLGEALFRRASLHARNLGLRFLAVHCLAENAAMMHLARKHGMRMVSQHGEAEGLLALPPADMSSHLSSIFEQGSALFDYALRRPLAGIRRMG